MAFRRRGGPVFRAAKPSLKFIDCHTHVFYRNQWKVNFAAPWLNRDFTIEDYQKDTEFFDLVSSVFVETNPISNDMQKETKFVTQLCKEKGNPLLSMIGSADVSKALMQNHVNRFVSGESKPYYKGIRAVGHTQPAGFLVQPQCLDNYAYCGKLGLMVEVTTRPEHLHLMVPVIKQYKDTTFILDHCGGLQGLKGDLETEKSWAAALRELAERPNCILKISGLAGGWEEDPRITESGSWHFGLQEDYVTHCLRLWDPNKLVFGLDWPINYSVPGSDLQAYVRNVGEVAEAVGGTRLREKLFVENAMRIYKLPLEDQAHRYTRDVHIGDLPKELSCAALQSRVKHNGREQVQFANTDKSFLDIYFETQNTTNARKMP